MPSTPSDTHPRRCVDSFATPGRLATHSTRARVKPAQPPAITEVPVTGSFELSSISLTSRHSSTHDAPRYKED
jgi:hypothetical protein